MMKEFDAMATKQLREAAQKAVNNLQRNNKSWFTAVNMERDDPRLDNNQFPKEAVVFVQSDVPGVCDYVAAASPRNILELYRGVDYLQCKLECARERIRFLEFSMRHLELLLGEQKRCSHWLAKMQQCDVQDDEPTRCPPRREPPNSCGGNDCANCWLKAAGSATAL